MAIGPSTVVIDGQRFAVPTKAAYNPYGFGQLTQPQPIQNVNFPPMVQSGGSSGAVGNAGSYVGKYGTADGNLTATQQAAQTPLGLRESPTWWAIIFAVVGLTGLIYIHWRKTILSGKESVTAGPASENAEVAA